MLKAKLQLAPPVIYLSCSSSGDGWCHGFWRSVRPKGLMGKKNSHYQKSKPQKNALRISAFLNEHAGEAVSLLIGSFNITYNQYTLSSSIKRSFKRNHSFENYYYANFGELFLCNVI